MANFYSKNFKQTNWTHRPNQATKSYWRKLEDQKLAAKMEKQTEIQEENRQALIDRLKEDLVEIATAEGYQVVGPDFERKIVLPNGAPVACMYYRGINFYMDALLYYRDDEFNWITTMRRTYLDYTLCTSGYCASGEIDNEITLTRKNEEADKLVDVHLVNGVKPNTPYMAQALFMHPAFGDTQMIGHMDIHTSSIYTFPKWCEVIKERFQKACSVVMHRYKEILKEVKKDEVKTAGAEYDAR
jgi:hypothetical protein